MDCVSQKFKFCEIIIRKIGAISHGIFRYKQKADAITAPAFFNKYGCSQHFRHLKALIPNPNNR